MIWKFPYTGYTQKKDAVSKVNRKFISHLTRAQRTPPAAQLSKFLMRYQQFASHAYCGAAGPVSKMASQQEKAFCVLRFEVSRSVITVQRDFRARFRKDAPCGVSCARVRWEINFLFTLKVHHSFVYTLYYLTHWGRGHLNCLNARSWGF